MRGEVVKSKPNKPSRLCFCWLMRNDAQSKKIGNYKHIRLSVIYQKGCCFGRNNRPRTDITVYFVLRQKINNFWNCPPLDFKSNDWFAVLYSAADFEMRHWASAYKSTSLYHSNASVRVKLTHGSSIGRVYIRMRH